MTGVGSDLECAVDWLERDEVVAIPTETVYGLAGNALSETAVRKIFAVKQRPAHNPLIVHVAEIARVEAVAREIPRLAWRLLEAFSPGPLTLLLPRSAAVPDSITAGLPRVAVRIPAHPVALNLLHRLPFPLAAPSANPFGYISPTSPAHVLAQLEGKIPYILDGGDCATGIESTVVGFAGEQVVIHRLGALSAERLRAITGSMELRLQDEASPVGPGMLLQHYAPYTPLWLNRGLEQALEHWRPNEIGLIAFAAERDELPVENQVVLSRRRDLAEAARNLYKAMHRLDAMGLRVIVAERLPDQGIGQAVNDRLARAAARSISTDRSGE